MSIAANFHVSRGAFTLRVDVKIPMRGVTVLFGPSGCGKTTLLRAIAGLDRHVGGTLKVGDEIWQDESVFLPTHRRPIGYVFQEASLFSHLSVKGNLEYGQKRVPASDRKVALSQAIELLGIGPLMERKPANLSGGERQRVAIARALAVSPRLLLMDEPLAGLDHHRKNEVLPYIKSLHAELDIPVIYVTHAQDEVARLAEYLILLEAGKVTSTGTAGEMLTRLDLPLAHSDTADSVIDATVAAHDDQYQLTYLDFPGGRFSVIRRDLPVGSPVRLQIAARDVSLTLAPPHETSILNTFPGVVEKAVSEGEAQTTVLLALGHQSLLARITRKSAAILDLKPGQAVYVQVKSVALL